MSYLKTTLENETAEDFNWLKQNNMLVNRKKFQVLFLSRKEELITSDMSLNVNNNSIISSNWVKLLGIKNESNYILSLDIFETQIHIQTQTRKTFILALATNDFL